MPSTCCKHTSGYENQPKKTLLVERSYPAGRAESLKLWDQKRHRLWNNFSLFFWLIWSSVLNKVCIFISDEKILSTLRNFPYNTRFTLQKATRPCFLLVSCLSSMALVSSLWLGGQEGHLMWSVKFSMFKHTKKVNNVEKVNRKKPKQFLCTWLKHPKESWFWVLDHQPWNFWENGEALGHGV